MADITVQNLTKYYGDRLILSDLTFDIQPGEKVAILGPNGAGKTTLLHILAGRLDYDGGHVSIGAGRTVGMIDQMPDYPDGVTVEDVLRSAFRDADAVKHEMEALEAGMAANPEDESLLRRYGALQQKLDALGGYNRDFEVDKVCNGLDIPPARRAQPVNQLSGGEKSRLRLCELMYDPLNMLVLDEPTNHLDLMSREWIEEAVEAFTGTLLFVSHDRYFVERFATRVIYLENGEYIDYTGSYEQFLAYRERLRAEKAPAPSPAAKKQAPKAEKPRQKGGAKNLSKRVTVLEREISRLEAELADLDSRINHNAADPEKLMGLLAEKEEADAELLGKMEEWERLSEELEG